MLLFFIILIKFTTLRLLDLTLKNYKTFFLK